MKIANVAFDCGDVSTMARFWSAVLDRPIDPGHSAESATIGGADEQRAEPAFYFNRVPEAKRAKNRVHLDLVDPDPAVVDKMVELGATTVANERFGSHSWTVMRDPEGNEFCVTTKIFTG